MAFGIRRFAIRNQTFGKRGSRRVSLVPSKTIKVNGAKQNPGERAKKGSSQLLSKATNRTK